MAIRDFGLCCTNCQVYWTCETKWYRGERHEENICCPICNYNKKCRSLKKGKAKKKKKT